MPELCDRPSVSSSSQFTLHRPPMAIQMHGLCVSVLTNERSCFPSIHLHRCDSSWLAGYHPSFRSSFPPLLSFISLPLSLFCNGQKQLCRRNIVIALWKIHTHFFLTSHSRKTKKKKNKWMCVFPRALTTWCSVWAWRAFPGINHKSFYFEKLHWWVSSAIQLPLTLTQVFKVAWSLLAPLNKMSRKRGVTPKSDLRALSTSQLEKVPSAKGSAITGNPVWSQNDILKYILYHLYWPSILHTWPKKMIQNACSCCKWHSTGLYSSPPCLFIHM